MVDAFRHRRQPVETFHDGVAVAEMLMALYRSAEIGQWSPSRHPTWRLMFRR